MADFKDYDQLPTTMMNLKRSGDMRPKFIQNSGKRNLDCQIQDEAITTNYLQSLLLILLYTRQNIACAWINLHFESRGKR